MKYSVWSDQLPFDFRLTFQDSKMFFNENEACILAYIISWHFKKWYLGVYRLTIGSSKPTHPACCLSQINVCTYDRSINRNKTLIMCQFICENVWHFVMYSCSTVVRTMHDLENQNWQVNSTLIIYNINKKECFLCSF